MMEKLSNDEYKRSIVLATVNELIEHVNDLTDKFERLSKSYADHYHHIAYDKLTTERAIEWPI